MSRYTIKVFGKKGCPKCSVLNKRLDKILKKKKWHMFTKQYFDITTVDGLVNFAEAEVLNPQRIPSFLIYEGSGDQEERPIPEQFTEGFDEETHTYRVPAYAGIQTDYSSEGVIRPSDIEDVFSRVL